MEPREILEKQLIENRLMRNKKETNLFEEAMDELFNEKSLDIVPIYIKAFDDETEHFEVMFGMVHAIDAYDNIFGLKNSMNTLLNSVHLFREEAIEWKEIIFIRIINNNEARNVLKSEINKLHSVSRNIIIEVLKSIKEDDVEKFGAYIDEVLSV